MKGEGRGSEHRCMPRISSTGSCKALATGQERVHGSIPVRTTLAQYERLLSALLGPYAMYAVHAASENAWTLICPCRPTPGANLHAASRQIARARQPRAWSGVGAGAPRSGRCHRSSRTSARSSARPSRPAGSGSASPRVAALGYTPRSRRRSSALRHEPEPTSAAASEEAHGSALAPVSTRVMKEPTAPRQHFPFILVLRKGVLRVANGTYDTIHATTEKLRNAPASCCRAAQPPRVGVRALVRPTVPSPVNPSCSMAQAKSSSVTRASRLRSKNSNAVRCSARPASCAAARARGLMRRCPRAAPARAARRARAGCVPGPRLSMMHSADACY